MRTILSKGELEKIYTPEKLTMSQLSATHRRYTYLDKSKKMVYIKDAKDTGDNYHVYSVVNYGQSIHLQKRDITQDEINLFDELIAGKLVEGNDKNFSNIRKSLQPQQLSTDIDIFKALNVDIHILSSLNPLKLPTSQYVGRSYNDHTELSNSTVSVSKKDDYLNRLFVKYWTTDKSNINFDKDGVDGLYAYPDAFIWKFHYEFERFSNEEALKFREFLMVPGIKELVNKGLFNWGDLQTCRHLDTAQAMQLIEIYNENKEAWKSIGSPKLVNLVFKGEQGYNVATKEEAREIAKNPSASTEFALTHDIRYIRLKRLSDYQNINQSANKQPQNELPSVEFDLAVQQKAQFTPLQQSLVSGFVGFWQPKIVNEKDKNQVVQGQSNSFKL